MVSPLNIFTTKKLVIAFLPIFLCHSFTQGEYSVDPHNNKINHHSHKKIFVQIPDENGKLTAAKVRVTEQDSIYYAPDGHLSNFIIGEGGGDAMLANNRRFAYVDGTFYDRNIV